MTRGKFIVVEGIDGAGTTTQSKLLVDWLVRRSIPAVWTNEPSTGPVGCLLRQILTGRLIAADPDGSSRSVHNDVISLLFAADRLDHLDCSIMPALRENLVVVSDRYYHSSFTYQSLEGDMEWLLSLNMHAYKPDITYILDLPPEQAEVRRKMAGREVEELYDSVSKQRRIRKAYLGLESILKGQEIMVIDASDDVENVQRSIRNDLKARFGWS